MIYVGKKYYKDIVITIANLIYEDINEKIQIHNECKRKADNKGNKGKKRKKEPHQEYMFELIIRKKKKGGIIILAYHDRNLIDLLYTFYEKVQKGNVTQEARLIENIISANKKATEMCVNILKTNDIKKVD